MSTPRPRYEPLDFVLVRTPLLPAAACPRDGVTPPTPRGEWIEAALATGSLDLSSAVNRGDETDRVARKLRRYRIRMATRPTPYGLLSGVALARWGDTTTLHAIDAAPRTRTRPDMAWLLKLALDLEASRDLRIHLEVVANTAALVRGGRIMLAERAVHAGDGSTPPAVSVRATGAACRVLERARRALPFAALCDEVAEQSGAPRARVEGLVHELLDQGLLVSTLRPPLTCAEPARWIIEHLPQVPEAGAARDGLLSVLALADDFDRSPAGERVERLHRIGDAAVALGAPASKPAVQVDTAFEMQGTLARAIGEEVARATEVLLRASPFPRGFPYLRAYAQAFQARYGDHREVPLLELLDAEWGLGPPDTSAHGGYAENPRRSQTLLELACEAARTGRLEVELDDALLSRLESDGDDADRAPSTLDVCAFVSLGGANSDDFTVVIGPNLGSQVAGRNLARFATLLGDDGAAAITQAVRADCSGDDALVAEVSYLPREFRLGNVATRPRVCEHEIVVGVSATAPPDRQIALDELVVGRDGDRLYLRWPGHAHRVRVTSTHMLNFRRAPAVCRFLVHMAIDAETQLHVFDWGPASSFPFLPRVRRGRAVLRPAQWRVGPETTGFAADTTKAFTEFFIAWRDSWKVPRFVYLGSGDVRLLLDLDDPRDIEELRLELRKLHGGACKLLLEALPGLDDGGVQGPGGRYLTELVVSLAQRSHEQPRGRAAVRAEKAAASEGGAPLAELERARTSTDDDRDAALDRCAVVARAFAPGSEWLTLKLYGSREIEDDLLGGPLRAFIVELEKAELIDGAFFVRYSDPAPHLRLRLHARTPDDADELLSAACALGSGLMAQSLCTRFDLDTYERETERYGGAETIEAAEALFCADSRFALDLLLEVKAGVLERELLGVLALHDLVEGLGLRAADEQALATRLVGCRRAAGARYREIKEALLSLIADPAGGTGQADPAGGTGQGVGVAVSGRAVPAGGTGDPDLPALLARRRVAVAALGERLRQSTPLTCSVDDICHSLLHMHCNRLLGRDRNDEYRAIGLMLRVREALRARRRPPR